MSPRLLRLFFALALGSMAASLALTRALAQTSPQNATENAPAEVAAAPPVKVAKDLPTPAKTDPSGATDPGASQPSPGASQEKVIREQTIYIPYEKLRQVFEKEGRGVFLPYERFRQLWEAAREKTEAAPEREPPVRALITEADNEATAEKDVVRVKALLKIEILGEGWNEVPLRLADAAITAATLDGKPARIVAEGQAGYKLLVEKKDRGPQQIELSLEYAKAITRMPGQNSVSFQAPQAPVSRWEVRIPESGVKVNFHPLIAATEVPSAAAAKAAPEKGAPAEETVVRAFVGTAPEVRIEWTPKAEGATGLEALASVQAEQQVFVGEGVTRSRSELRYTISRAELGLLSIDVPADQKVANVFDANVKQWSVEPIDDGQRINVELFEPARATQTLIVELEKFAGDRKDQSLLRVPVVKAVGVSRQQGLVVVQVASGLRAEAGKVSGLLQVDTGELPDTLARGTWTFSYRYAAVPFELELSLEKVQPRILVDSLVEAELQPKQLTLDLLAIYTIERAGVFRLEMDVPAGYEVGQPSGREAAGAAPVEVDSHHLEGPDKTRLVVNLSRKAMGRVGLAVRLQRDLNEPKLLAVTGERVKIPLKVPQVAPETVERASGRLVLYAAESLLVSPVEEEPAGFRSITTKAALEGLAPAPGRDSSKVRALKAYAFTGAQPALELTAERRKPEVRVRQLLVARVEHGSVNYEATFSYEILYSSVKSLRIDVPAEVAQDQGLRNRTTTLQEMQLDPPPDDLAPGYVAWSFASDAELIGKQTIQLAWKQQIDQQADAQKPVKVVIPHLKPHGVELPWGQIVLAKAETIDLRVLGEATGLRPIDPQHDLMDGAHAADAAAAFEFHDDWSLAVAATRYALEEVPQTSIERAVLRMVVTRADKVPVQALYRMRSGLQRLRVKIPPEAEFDSAPRINGRSVPLETDQSRKEEYLVPLVGQDADKPFLLELRYTVPGDGSRLDRPVFPLEAPGDQASGAAVASAPAAQAAAPAEPATQEIYVCAYLPEEQDLVHKRGPWTERFRWGLSETLEFLPYCRPNDAALLDWVSPELDLSESFPVDGRLYVFSALRPAAPPDGSLRLTTVNAAWLKSWVIGILAAAGLLLIPFGAGLRVLAIGVLVVAMVIAAVFFPIFVWQISDGSLVGAVAVVLVVWVFWYFAYTRPRARARRGVEGEQPPPGPSPPDDDPWVFPDEAPGEAGSEEGGATDD